MTPDPLSFFGPRWIEPTVRGITVGRRGSADIALEHPSVSPRHALLAVGAGGILLRDLGSRQGTFVGGKRVERATLRSGDRVAFGAVEYRVAGNRLESLGGAGGLAFHARGLTIARGERRLLQGVALSVKPGQFVGLLGASGSGKSTLLKCLAGYVPPADGSRVTAGEWTLPDDVAVYRRHVGYVPQDDLTVHGLSARSNLDYALRLRSGGLGRPERRRLVDGVLAQLGLTHVADRPARELSGGERRRLNVGIELLGQPRVLFLDEPTAGLDPAAESDVMQLLLGIARQGVTVFCATHIVENLRLFDTVLVLAHRRIDYTGPWDGLLSHYHASNYPDLYRNLEKQRRDDRAAIPEARPKEERRAARMRPPEEPIGLAAQVRILTARGLALIARDPLFAALLVLQPLLIGLLINLSQFKPTNEVAVLTFLAVTSVWLGLNNAARELVRERKLYIRERLLGVTPLGYLIAKVLLLGSIGLAQVALLVAVVRYASFMHEFDAQDYLKEWPFWQVLLANGTAYLSALLLGLTVSARANSEEVAVAWLPVIILPQLLLTAAATGLDGQSPQTGHFRPLPVLARALGQEVKERQLRPIPALVLDGASLFVYTRPVVSVLHRRGLDTPTFHRWRWTDAAHALVLLAGTAALLGVVFRKQEKLWLESA